MIRQAKAVAIEDNRWNEGDQKRKPSDQGNKSATTITIGDDPTEKRSTKTKVYRYGTSDMFAEDVDQRMAI